ncbi:MAG: ketopantoate reductase C-terminal domain-containing protein, partial [Alphaproteobacteria bacterium]|nr:ketopantoate reductase C-terminal domain-containing protein [Alphaproteobacteria bacterium]
RRFRRVYAMLVYLPANALEPGVVQTHALETIGVLDAGVYPQGTDDLIAEVTGALTAARFSAVPNPTVLRFKYAKLLMNLGNAISAVSPPGEAATEIRRQLQAEGRACLDAAGIDLASREEVRERRGELIRMGEIDGQGRQFGSSWQSLTRGTGDIEADYLNGEIVLLGRLHGVPTPANAVLQRLANTLAREHAPAQSIPLAELQRRISAEASG